MDPFKSVLFIRFLFIGAVEKIIDRNLMKIGKLYKYFGWNIKLSALIITVNALTAR